jgi:hypothetical protein
MLLQPALFEQAFVEQMLLQPPLFEQAFVEQMLVKEQVLLKQRISEQVL